MWVEAHIRLDYRNNVPNAVYCTPAIACELLEDVRMCI